MSFYILFNLLKWYIQFMHKLICSYIWHLFSTHYVQSTSWHIKKKKTTIKNKPTLFLQIALTSFFSFLQSFQIFLPNILPTPCPTGHSSIYAAKPLCPQVTLHHFQYLGSDHHTSISFPKIVFFISCCRPVCFDLQASSHGHLPFPWCRASHELAFYHGQPYFPSIFIPFIQDSSPSRKLPQIGDVNAVTPIPGLSPLSQTSVSYSLQLEQ